MADYRTTNGVLTDDPVKYRASSAKYNKKRFRVEYAFYAADGKAYKGSDSVVISPGKPLTIFYKPGNPNNNRAESPNPVLMLIGLLISSVGALIFWDPPWWNTFLSRFDK